MQPLQLHLCPIFSGKGENVAQFNTEEKALTLKGCLRLPNLRHTIGMSKRKLDFVYLCTMRGHKPERKCKVVEENTVRNKEGKELGERWSIQRPSLPHSCPATYTHLKVQFTCGCTLKSS